MIALLLLATALYQPMEKSFAQSSSFLESRGHRYHAGIDFDTEDKEGWKIYSPEAGQVYRIRRNTYGYGKTIYFQGKSGKKYVFAHLSGYAPVIWTKVYAYAHKKKKSEFSMYPKIPLDSGALLGFSGSTGIGNPHLHFEVRDSLDNPIQPQNIKYIDTIPPILKQLAFIDRQGQMTHNSKISGDSLTIPQMDSEELAIELVDYADIIGEGPMSIASLKLTGCKRTLFHKDYQKASYGRMSIITEDLLGNNSLDWHYLGPKKGRDPNILTSSRRKECSLGPWLLQVKDRKGNTNSLTIVSSSALQKTPPAKQLFPYDSSYTSISKKISIKQKGLSLEGTLLPTYLQYKISIRQNKDTWQLLPRGLPWKKKFKVCLTDRTKKKQIFYQNSKKKWEIYSTQKRKGDQICAKDFEFTALKLFHDPKAPEIISILETTLSRHGKQYQAIQIKIQDFSGFSSANQMKALGPHFIPTEWDYESQTLSLVFYKKPKKITLELKDDFGNVSKWKINHRKKEWTYSREQLENLK